MIFLEGERDHVSFTCFDLIYEGTHLLFSKIHSSAIILPAPNYLRSAAKVLNIL